MNYRRAFTLIELLVVISIIALLASVVLAALNSARDKGRLGGAKYFSAQVDHISGDQLVGKWDFEEGAGSATDSSGLSNNGTSGSWPTWQATGGYNGGGAYSFDGVNNVITIANYNPPSPDITIAFWTKLTALPASQTGTYPGFIGKGGSFTLEINKATGKLSYGAMTGGYLGTTAAINETTNWHFIVLVISGTAGQFYFDGLQDNKAAVLAPTTAVGNLQIGAGWGNKIQAMIDGVRIFAKTLTASEVGKLYAEGLKTHSLARE